MKWYVDGEALYAWIEEEIRGLQSLKSYETISGWCTLEAKIELLREIKSKFIKA